MSAATRYRVTAATVVAQFSGAPFESYFGYGAILPDGITQASKQHLLSIGFIQAVEEIPDPAELEAAAEAQVEAEARAAAAASDAAAAAAAAVAPVSARKPAKTPPV